MFRAIGFVIGLIAVRLMLPVAFDAFEGAATQFFHFSGEIFAHPPTAVVRDMQDLQTAGVNFIPQPTPLPEAYR